jgi:hypothetical protein
MLHSGSSGGFDEYEQCDRARRDGSSTEQRHEWVNMRTATGRDNTDDFHIYSTLDKFKSFLSQRARAEADNITTSRIECGTADYSDNLVGRSIRTVTE